MITPDPMIALLNKIPESNRKVNKKLNKSTPNILIENVIQHLREYIAYELCDSEVVIGEGTIRIECYEECIKLLEELIYG